MLYNPNDTVVGRSLDLYGEYAEAESILFRQIIKKGNVVLEAGSHIGAQTLLLARLASNDGAVIAFEPQRILFQTLCANMALNGLDNVFARNRAIGSETGTVSVPSLDPRAKQNFGALRLGEHRKGERIPLTTIDTLALQRCNFIKIDVPGMETAAVLGAQGTITRLNPILYIAADAAKSDETDRELINLVTSLKYKLYWHRSSHFDDQNYAGNANDVFAGAFSMNMLCVPMGSKLEVRGLPPVDIR